MYLDFPERPKLVFLDPPVLTMGKKPPNAEGFNIIRSIADALKNDQLTDILQIAGNLMTTFHRSKFPSVERCRTISWLLCSGLSLRFPVCLPRLFENDAAQQEQVQLRDV